MSARAIIRNLSTIRGFYFKEGYNVVVRYISGDSEDDERDCFEYLGYRKTKKDAKTLASSYKKSVAKLRTVNPEIFKYKSPSED